MIEAKHQALVEESQRRGHANIAQLRLCFQLLSLSSSIDRDCAARLAPHGLSEGRFIVLFLLHGAGGTLPPHLLAERAGVTRATISGLLDGLQREGLLQRRSDDGDGRRLQIVLTAPESAWPSRCSSSTRNGSAVCSTAWMVNSSSVAAAAQGLAAYGRRAESAA